MSRTAAALAFSLLPGLALSQGPGLAFLTKFAPGVVPSAGTQVLGLDARRKTALIASYAPEIWPTPTIGVQYYLRSFEGLPLERIPLEQIRPRVATSFGSGFENLHLAADGRSVLVNASDTSTLSGAYYVYNRDTKTFTPVISQSHPFTPLEVIGGTTIIGWRQNPGGGFNTPTVRLDLATGEQTVITSETYGKLSPDGKYLFNVYPPDFGNPAGYLNLFNVAAGKIRKVNLPGMIASGLPYGWFTPDRRTLYYLRGTSLEDAKIVKLDPFNLKETVYEIPAEIRAMLNYDVSSSFADGFGDRLIVGQKVWTLSTGGVVPLFANGGQGWSFAKGYFLTAATVLVDTDVPLIDGDMNNASDPVTGTAGGAIWRPIVGPRSGTRTTKFSIISPDDRYVVTAYNPVGNEAGGQPVGFVRKDLQTGTVTNLPGRATAPDGMMLSDGGRKALLLTGNPVHLVYRDLDTGAETPIDLGGRATYHFGFSPAGEAVVVRRQTDTLPTSAFLWTPSGVSEVPLPAGTTDVHRVSVAGGRLVVGVSGAEERFMLGTITGTGWKPLAPAPNSAAEEPALTRDGATVSLFSRNSNNAYYTRLFRSSDAKLLKTIPYAGTISGDGAWLMPTIYGSNEPYYIATGATAVDVPARAEGGGVEAVGPWRLPTPNGFIKGSPLPMAYRPTVFRNPQLRLVSLGSTAGGVVSVNVAVTKAGLENSSHTIRYRFDGGDWQTSTMDFFHTSLPEGLHTLELYAEDAQGRRSATLVQSVYADATAPVITDIRHEISGRTATLRATCPAERSYSPTVEFGFSRNGGNYSWTRANGSSPDWARDYTGLTRGVVYTYRVRATDLAGNQTISPEFTFTLP
ncbi:hypothetical protein EON81_03545 [bacterium]|nr:MAG: hypothetical protein EON81_03545 [bacterium]